MDNFKDEFDSAINRRASGSIKWDEDRKDLLALSLADMDFRSPPCLRKALQKNNEHGIYGYRREGKDYFQQIKNWMKKRHSWEIKQEWIEISPGILSGLSFLIEGLTNPGDEIIVQPPVYFSFFPLIRKNGRQVVANPLKYEDGYYTMDFRDLKAKISSKTRLLILCSPHNPVGRVWKEEELTRLGEICLENNITIISDEIHSDLIYTGNRHIPLPALDSRLAENTVVCTSPSKTFNCPGLQPGNMIIPGEKLRNIYHSQRQRFDFEHLTIPAAEATKAVYKHGEPWLNELLAYLDNNLSYLVHFIEENIPEIQVIKPEGTYLVWLNFRQLNMSSKKLFYKLKTEANLKLTPGHTFGKAGEGFMRINIACPHSRLQKAAANLKSFL